MAGLMPRLQHGGVPGSEEWIYVDPIVPGARPLESLALALAERLPDRSLARFARTWKRTRHEACMDSATTITHGKNTKVLLCVDQFEELFTQASVREEREQFLELIVTALSEPRGPVVVILTLRADFYDRMLSSPVLGPLIEQHQCAIFPMNVLELRMVMGRGLPDLSQYVK